MAITVYHCCIDSDNWLVLIFKFLLMIDFHNFAAFYGVLKFVPFKNGSCENILNGRIDLLCNINISEIAPLQCQVLTIGNKVALALIWIEALKCT